MKGLPTACPLNQASPPWFLALGDMTFRVEVWGSCVEQVRACNKDGMAAPWQSLDVDTLQCGHSLENSLWRLCVCARICMWRELLLTTSKWCGLLRPNHVILLCHATHGLWIEWSGWDTCNAHHHVGSRHSPDNPPPPFPKKEKKEGLQPCQSSKAQKAANIRGLAWQRPLQHSGTSRTIAAFMHPQLRVHDKLRHRARQMLACPLCVCCLCVGACRHESSGDSRSVKSQEDSTHSLDTLEKPKI